jgi:hypothetical protein
MVGLMNDPGYPCAPFCSISKVNVLVTFQSDARALPEARIGPSRCANVLYPWSSLSATDHSTRACLFGPARPLSWASPRHATGCYSA